MQGRAGTLCLCLHRGDPAHGHPHHVPPWVCPSRGDAWRVQRCWMLSQQLAQGTSPALPRPASAAGALLPGTAPCGQTNGLAVDQRGAGCGRPGTYRRGICRAKNGSGATRSLPAPRGTAGTWGHLHSLVVGWVRACAGEGEGLQAVSEGMLSPCPALAQFGCELWDGTTLMQGKAAAVCPGEAKLSSSKAWAGCPGSPWCCEAARCSSAQRSTAQ